MFNGFWNESIDLIQISILCSSVIGSGISFFLYNKHPAKIFMGDTGSFFYGAFLSTVAICLKQEILYGIMGLLFIIEIVSVILQVLSFKYLTKEYLK